MVVEKISSCRRRRVAEKGRRSNHSVSSVVVQCVEVMTPEVLAVVEEVLKEVVEEEEEKRKNEDKTRSSGRSSSKRISNSIIVHQGDVD